MDERYYKEIFDAAQVLCNFCCCVDCDKCMVNQLVSDAYDELPNEDEEEI